MNSFNCDACGRVDNWKMDIDIWDGKDVQGEDEDISNSEDVVSSSLVVVNGKTTIHHFSHQHDLMNFASTMMITKMNVDAKHASIPSSLAVFSVARNVILHSTTHVQVFLGRWTTFFTAIR
ncbi:unnamed protein product [Microthlaspi erraticum]|uniref:Uncharacterized protein n=1 Tax=Microthlaspi erraticum TaxID=1685480 RepID=A0A6D2HMX1_9BRAS|nr:unnamed protein product [Microthlaspi erraticum]